jgi:hypothetical protein
MKQKSHPMKPQDIVILLKIIALETDQWQQIPLAESLSMSQSEVSQSLARSRYADLLVGKQVMKSALLEFLQYGLAYVFPQKPGAIVRGIATAHTAPPLKDEIDSTEHFVWPFAKGKERGQAIVPLYSSVPEAALKDQPLYELLALTDALRVGKIREKAKAIAILKQRFK